MAEAGILSVTVGQTVPDAVLLVSAYGAASEAGAALAAALGCTPAAPNRWTGGSGVVMASAGAGRWTVIGQGQAGASLAGRVEAAMADRAAVVDLTHAREVFTLAGGAARDVIAKGCTADLRASVLGPGAALATAIGKIGVTILAHEGERFDILVPASYASFFAEWLEVASREFA